MNTYLEKMKSCRKQLQWRKLITACQGLIVQNIRASGLSVSVCTICQRCAVCCNQPVDCEIKFKLFKLNYLNNKVSVLITELVILECIRFLYVKMVEITFQKELLYLPISSERATKLIWMEMDCDSTVAQALGSLLWMR